ncbi:MAG: ribonuclease P protein component [Cyanobacteria bacterium KgW148]|nr:ribonuclease P protein component [Cyanobacteria bacterium KgW148]
MLPFDNRLRHRSDFKEVLSSGVYVKGKFLTVKFVRNFGTQSTLVGFVISKKFSKRACDRNLLKRRLRSIMREFLGHLVGGLKLVVMVSRPQIDVSFSDLRDDLRDVLTRADLYGD